MYSKIALAFDTLNTGKLDGAMFSSISSHQSWSYRLKATRQLAPTKADKLMVAKVLVPLVGAGVGDAVAATTTGIKQVL